jgi:salicylate hydroxylase
MRNVANRPFRVAIVGGGIGGLTAAVALHQRGFEVAVYERSSKLEEVGAGLQVGPNGVKVIRGLGLWDQFEKIAFQPVNQVSIKWDDASLRNRVPLREIATRDYGAPYTTLHRAHLHELLRNALPASGPRSARNCSAPTTHASPNRCAGAAWCRWSAYRLALDRGCRSSCRTGTIQAGSGRTVT